MQCTRFLPAVDLDLAVQQPAALDRVVRDVDVLPHRDRVAAHDRVAVVAVLVHGVHAVHAVLAVLVGEELVLRHLGPAHVAPRVLVVLALHLLQEGDVRAQPFSPSRMPCSTRRLLNCDRPLWMLYVTTVRLFLLGMAVSDAPFRQLSMALAVAPGKDALGGLLPGQPHRAEVLARAPP
jgi:hypothetical protein